MVHGGMVQASIVSNLVDETFIHGYRLLEMLDVYKRITPDPHLSLNSRTEEFIPLMTLLPRREARPGVGGAEVEAAAGGAGSSRKEAGAGLGTLASASPGPGASDGDRDRASNTPAIFLGGWGIE